MRVIFAAESAHGCASRGTLVHGLSRNDVHSVARVGMMLKFAAESGRCCTPRDLTLGVPRTSVSRSRGFCWNEADIRCRISSRLPPEALWWAGPQEIPKNNVHPVVRASLWNDADIRRRISSCCASRVNLVHRLNKFHKISYLLSSTQVPRTMGRQA
jgi:hypothetical protein